MAPHHPESRLRAPMIARRRLLPDRLPWVSAVLVIAVFSAGLWVAVIAAVGALLG